GICYMVSRLQVRTDNKLAALTQRLLHVNAKRFHEFVLVIKNGQIVLANKLLLATERTRSQHTGHRHLVEIRLNKTAFAVSLLIGKTVHNRFWEMTGINTHSTMLIQLTVDKVSLITFRNQIFIFNLIGAHTVILHAHHVCILLRQPLEKALFNSLLQTIDAD